MTTRNPARRSIASLVLALAAFTVWPPSSAHAGCGCDKPPPALATVRPNVTFAGTPISFFSAAFVVGTPYTVTFTSGTVGTSASVSGTVANLRDLADGAYKPQLVVDLPVLPLGPTRITVTKDGATTPDVSLPDTAFTVAPDAVAVPYAYGIWDYANVQAAVDRSGVLYISMDLTGVTEPLVYDAQMLGLPWRFANKDVVYKNDQGFLMQTLLDAKLLPIPGMFVVPSATTTDSNVLRYSRHEFDTYFLQHMEHQPHQVDPTDPNWHLDGTRHIDHDHLILALSGKLLNGAVPAAGATAPFTMRIKAYSLFYTGLTGTGSIAMSGAATTDSIDSNTGEIGPHGDVFTQGSLTMKGTSIVNGDAAAAKWSVATTSKITGIRYAPPAGTFMSIKLPPGLPSLGAIAISTPTTRMISGPGSFLVSSITLSGGGQLFIDNSAGPVTLYVTGAVKITGGSIQAADPKPEKFAVYMASSNGFTMTSSLPFTGVVYAPASTVALSNLQASTNPGIFTGAFFGKALTMSYYARVRYDKSLRGNF